MKINISSRFGRAYKRLPKHVKDDFDNKISIFIKDTKDSKLKTHKLQQTPNDK